MSHEDERLAREIINRMADPADLSAVGHRCFFCWEFLVDPAVMWNGCRGGDQNVYLHGACVMELIPKLMLDALELKYYGKPCWNQLEGRESHSK